MSDRFSESSFSDEENDNSSKKQTNSAKFMLDDEDSPKIQNFEAARSFESENESDKESDIMKNEKYESEKSNNEDKSDSFSNNEDEQFNDAPKHSKKEKKVEESNENADNMLSMEQESELKEIFDGPKKLTEDEIKEKEEKMRKQAEDIIIKLHEAYQIDESAYKSKTHSFQRFKFLKELEEYSKNSKLTKILVGKGLFRYLGTWLKPFSEKDPVPNLTIREKVIRILLIISQDLVETNEPKSKKNKNGDYDLTDDQDNNLELALETSDIISVVTSTAFPIGSPQDELKEKLLTFWRRSTLSVQSGRNIQRATVLFEDEELRTKTKEGLKRQRVKEGLIQQKEKELDEKFMKKFNVNIKSDRTYTTPVRAVQEPKKIMKINTK